MTKEQHTLVMAHYKGCQDEAWDEIEAAMIAMRPLYEAAPELLEALEGIAELPGGTVGSALTLAKDKARAAIAKARGEA
jgi:hypothetical protein